MMLAALPLAAIATTTAASAAAAGALSCNGSVIYSVERGSSASSTGTLNALTTGTVGGSSVTATAISSIPAGGNANALGITFGGTGAYLVDQTTSSVNSARIHYYAAATGSWSTFTGSSGSNDSFVAGAVDPANGIYYYASYFAGTSTTSAYANVYGFNTLTNTAIPGIIGRVNLGTGDSAAGQNGDLAFDGSGNMYLLSSNGTNVAINIVPAPVPLTGSSGGATLTSTLQSFFASSAKYNGIAFDNNGNLYVEDASASNVSEITKLNPITGAVLAGPTALSSNAQTFLSVDLGACSVNPTLQLQANVAGRFTPTDQFGLSITGGGLASGNTATTTGTATGVQSAAAGPVIAGSGNTYTLTETAASGDLSNYTVTYSCIDTANGNSVVASGTGPSITLPFPPTTSTSPTVACTFTNVPLAATPGISVAKTASPTSFDKPGTTITYSFAVKNTGNVALSAVQVNDTDLPGLSAISCPSTTLAAKATETCTATYSTTQADLDAGSVTNTATAQGNPPGSTTPVVSDPSTATVPAAQVPGISLVKSASPSTFSRAGQAIAYSFLVTNTGNVTLSGVLVNDTDLAGLSAITCPSGTLAPAAHETCTATYSTTQADVDAGSVPNTATAQGTPPGSTTPAVSAPSTATVSASQAPGISVVKSASPTIFSKAGQTITYSFLVTDTGNVTMSAVQVNDTDLPGLSAITCPSATLAPGIGETCSATYSTTQADVDAGSVSNTATAQGTPPRTTTPVMSDPSTATVPAAQVSGISLVKSASPSSVSRAGQVITYSFLVTNTGNVTLSGVLVNDTDLPGLSAITCPSATLAADAHETCTATYSTTQADMDRGSISNTATAQGTPPGSTTPVVSDPSKATAPAEVSRGISLVKSASPATFSRPGQTITYSFLVTNAGNVNLSGVKVNDTDRPGLSPISCPSGTLAPGVSETCTATYSTTEANVDAGSVTNTATAQGTPPGSTRPRSSDPASVTITAPPGQGISLVKSASPSTFSKAGQVITYSFLVTSKANVTLSDVRVNDTDLPGLSAITCPSGTLAADAHETCTATYSTTQADMDRGSVSNTATAEGTAPGATTPFVSNPSTVTVRAVQVSAISLVKSANSLVYSYAGETIGYRFLVTNIGNVTLSKVGITDGLPGLSAISCPRSSLAPGADETCTAGYVITNADVSAGQVVNTATAHGTAASARNPVVSPRSSVGVYDVESTRVPVTG
jgi:uncharacterized repeat protein (TIGR01451 family)